MARKLLTPVDWPRWPVILLLAILLAVPAIALQRMQINDAPSVYFPPDAEAVRFENELRTLFPSDHLLILLFAGRPETLFAADFLGQVHTLTRSLNRHPLVERVLAVTNADHIAGSEEGFAVERLVDVKTLQGRAPQETYRRAAGDRFAPGFLLAKDGSAVAVVVRPKRSLDSLEAASLHEFSLQAVRTQGLEERLSAVAGHVALVTTQLNTFLHDLTVFVPTTTAIGLILLWWMFRRSLVVVAALISMATGVGMALATVVWLERPFTLIGAIIPSLISALAVAMLIHWFTSLAHAAQRGVHGEARQRAALAEIERPARYTALTTAAGLGSLAFSPVQPVATFGLAAAVGVMVLYVVILWMLPALFASWDQKSWPVTRTGLKQVTQFVDALLHISLRRPIWVISIFALLVIVAIPSVLNVYAETDVYRFFPDDHPLTESTRLAEDKLSGIIALEVVFSGAARDALKDPAVLRAIDQFQHWADNHPLVNRTLAMTDLIEDMHWAFNEEKPEFRRLPENRALISQYLLVYDGRDLYDLVDREFKNTRISIHLNAHGTREIQRFISDARTRLAQWPATDVNWRIAGLGRLYADQDQLMTRGQVQSAVGALLLIYLLLALFWRSPAAGGLAMIPNISPVLLVFMIMGWFGIWLDMATAMIASVAVGIAVDDTIHLYDGYRRCRRGGLALVPSIVRTYSRVGRAVTATTIILSAQFLVLTLSDFSPIQYFGLLTFVGLLAALLFDLLLLPSLFVLSERLRSPR